MIIPYYDPNKMLSYNRILNFIIGARGIGKSFAMKEYPINRFLKHGKQFVYLRRYKPELKKVPQYFDDVIASGKFPDVEFKVKGRQFFINGKLAGWAIPLSTWQSEKSSAYPNVETIIFDEFIRQKDNSGYIPNEVDALLNLMDTIIRDRDNARCICLSNAVTVVNPYFLYFDLVPNIDKRFNAYKDMLIEIPESQDFSEYRRKTRFGRLIDGTEYGDMSLDNEFINDSSVFVDRRSKISKFSFSLVYKGMTIGIWVDHELGLMYMSNDHDPSTKKVYALSTEDLQENIMLMNNWKDAYHIYKMVNAFKNGYLRFDNQILRTLGYEIFKRLNIH